MKNQHKLLIILLAVFVSFGVAKAVRFYHSGIERKKVRALEEAALIPKSFVPPVPLIDKTGDFLGDAKAPFTIIEFGDYQCPPCAHQHTQVSRLMSKYPHQLRFQFRHLPLSEIHPFAVRAACIAEAARRGGRFKEAHNRLYALNANLTEANLQALQKSLQLTDKSVRASSPIVQRDIALARSVGCDGTPTFFLVAPNDKTYRLQSLEQLEMLIEPTITSR